MRHAPPGAAVENLSLGWEGAAGRGEKWAAFVEEAQR